MSFMNEKLRLYIYVGVFFPVILLTVIQFDPNYAPKSSNHMNNNEKKKDNDKRKLAKQTKRK